MTRRTKIIATLGPSTDTPESMTAILQAGVNLVRINLSHGTQDEHAKRIALATSTALTLGIELGVLVDLQGPKIRISKFKKNKVTLKEGQPFTIDVAMDPNSGDEHAVGADLKSLPQDVNAGDTLLLADGLLSLQVDKIDGSKIHCTVLEGGILSNNKGINRKGGGLTAEMLTPKDRSDIEFIATQDVDYVALSFVRTPDDIKQAQDLLAAAGSDACIIAKIECAEALEQLDEIIECCDGVMVARGDLGVEIGYAELPGVQKNIISRARALNRAVITATQMMESMIESPIPTRAEVFDVANAILDGTDAVMFSAETAMGNHPDKVIQAVASICESTEKQPVATMSKHRLKSRFERVDETIAMAAMYAANHIDVAAIVALTETGTTPLWMSRIRSSISIYALSRNARARGRMTLFRGVFPIEFDVTAFPRWKVVTEALEHLKSRRSIMEGDRIILTKGDRMGVDGRSNTLRFINVGKYRGQKNGID